jgi:hypothetical protein
MLSDCPPFPTNPPKEGDVTDHESRSADCANLQQQKKKDPADALGVGGAQEETRNCAWYKQQ